MTGERKEFSEETINKLRRRAISSAKQRGFIEQAEDIAQMVLLNLCEGYGQHQTIDQAVLDAIRNLFGRDGRDHHLRDAVTKAVGLYRKNGTEKGYADVKTSIEFFGDFERMMKCLKPKAREVLRLYFIQGYTEKEIGSQLGFTESYICVIKRAALLRLKSITQL